MGRGRRVTFALTLGALCALGAMVSPPTASATPPPVDIVPTVGGQTPFEAAGLGNYTNSSYSALAKRLGYELDSQLATKEALSEAEWQHFTSRTQTAAAKGGLVPRLRTIAPYIKFAGAAGLIVGGYEVYKLTTTDWDSITHDTYVEIELDQVGTSSVFQPAGFTAGAAGDYRLGDGSSAAATFGWAYSTAYNGAGTPKGWLFQYVAQMAWGTTGASCSPNCYPKWAGWGGTNNIVPFIQSGIPRYSPECVVQLATCYGSTLTGTKAGLQANLAGAANSTMAALAGDLVPLKVQLDTDATAIGHVRPSANCTAGGAGPFHAAPCLLAHIPERTAEIFLPRKVTESAPAHPLTGTITTTAPDLDTAGEWTDILDELDDGCGRAMFNHLAMPNTYPYYGCEPAANDPDAGPTVPQAEPEPYVLPRPNVNETATAYRARLEALGHLGTITLIETDLFTSYGPNAVVRVTLPDRTPARVLDPLSWPAPAPTVSLTEDVVITHNPGTATPVPTDPVSVPGLDLSPITDIDFGCRFPFGFVCYAIDVTEWFEVAPDAPRFELGDVCVGNPAGGELCGGPYSVDLEVMDDYMSLLRGLMSVALWIGTVYLLATRLLGFRAGGDPGEAVDEGLDWT